MTWLPLAFIAPLLFAIYQAPSKLLPKGASIYLVNVYYFVLEKFYPEYLPTAYAKRGS